jgi:hypothetical protein
LVGSEVSIFPFNTTALIMKIAYGYQILSDDDEYIRMAENNSLAVGIPGTTPPVLLPFCAFFSSTKERHAGHSMFVK